MKLKLPIRDELFAHAKTSSFWNESDYIEWDRINVDDYDFIFLTDNNIKDGIMNKKKYVWLIESPEITPGSYEYVKQNKGLFEKIFTFDREILENYENSLFLPYGGSMLDKNDITIHNKTKNVSMMLSFKNDLEGHKLRHIIRHGYDGRVDFYGTGFNGVNEKKIVSVKDYRFSVSIENCKKDYYFTEKIIDCFLTGTIPIYWGCPSIGDFFNKDGIIMFDKPNDLNKVLNNLSEEYYVSMKDVIKDNYERAKKYMIAENFLYNNYNNIITQ
jgi:hypothetical protein